MTEHELTITFHYHPGGGRTAPLLEATLPNGARFVVDPRQIHGKLGANLDLFAQRALLESKGETPDPIKPKPPEYDEELVTVVAPGRAYGVNASADKAKKRAAHRAKQRAMENITLADIGL